MFPATNNEVEYKAILTGLKDGKELAPKTYFSKAIQSWL